MGAAQSTTTSTLAVVNKAVSQTILSTLQNCAASATAGQTVDVSGSGNNISGINQSQAISINVSCLSNAATTTKLQADISNSIKQTLDQKSVALLSSLGMPSASARINIDNEVKNVFSQSNIQNCVTSLSGIQGVVVSGSNNTISGITQTQALSSISDCVSKQVQNLSTVMAAVNKADQDVKNTSTNPLDFIGDLFSGLSNVVLGGMALIVVVLIILLIAWKATSGGAPAAQLQQMLMMKMMSGGGRRDS